MGQGLAGSCTDRRLRSRAGAGRGGGARRPGEGRLILAATRLDGGTRGCSDDENDNNNNEHDYNDDNNRKNRIITGIIRPGSLGGGIPLFSSRLSSCLS